MVICPALQFLKLRMLAQSIHAKGGSNCFWCSVSLGRLPLSPLSVFPLTPPHAQLSPPYHPKPEISNFLISKLLPETPGTLLWRGLWNVFYDLFYQLTA